MKSRSLSPERTEIVRWTAGLGAVTAEALACRWRVSVTSARASLGAAARVGLLARHRPLVGKPALYTVTRAGLRAAELSGFEPCRVSPAGAQHMIACAWIAAALERRYAGSAVIGEPELRRRERELGGQLASAVLSWAGARGKLLHRPDLALIPPGRSQRPIAIEVELTIKAPRRLAEICRAWARSRHLDGVIYLAPPAVARAVERAIDAAHAEELVVVVPLDAVQVELPGASSESCVPSEP